MRDPNHCFNESCNCGLGPESMEILCAGEIIGMLCENCLRVTPGLTIHIHKNDKGKWELENVRFMEKTF